MFCVFSFPPGVYVETLNLIASRNEQQLVQSDPVCPLEGVGSIAVH